MEPDQSREASREPLEYIDKGLCVRTGGEMRGRVLLQRDESNGFAQPPEARKAHYLHRPRIAFRLQELRGAHGLQHELDEEGNPIGCRVNVAEEIAARRCGVEARAELEGEK